MFVLLAKIVGCCGISCKKLPHVVPKLQQCLPATFFGNAPQKSKMFCKQPTPFPTIIPHHRANFKIVCKISPPNLRNRFAKGTSNTIPNAQKPSKNRTPARQNTTQPKQGTSLAKQNTTLAPTTTQNFPQSPHTTPHHFATLLWEGRIQPPCCPIVWQRTTKVLALRTAKFATRVWNLTTNHATPPNHATTALPHCCENGVANHLVAPLHLATPMFTNKHPTQTHQTNAQQQKRYLQLCFANTQPEGMKKAPRFLLVRLMCRLVEHTPCLVIC